MLKGSITKKVRNKILIKTMKKKQKYPYGVPETTFDDLLTKKLVSPEMIDEIKETIDYIILLNDSFTSNWIPIKHMIQRFSSRRFRALNLLSVRDYSTRKQRPNDFDFACMNYWKEKTNTELFIPEHLLHSKDHVYKPPGWFIVLNNEICSANNRINKEQNANQTNNCQEKVFNEFSKKDYGKYSKVIKEHFRLKHKEQQQLSKRGSAS